MKRIASTVVVILLMSMMQPALAGKKEKLASLKTQTDGAHLAYTTCMELAGQSYSGTDAQPRDIADAAQSKCSDSYYAFASAMEAYLLASAGRAFLADQSRIQANEIASQVKDKTKGRVMELVLDARLKRGAP